MNVICLFGLVPFYLRSRKNDKKGNIAKVVSINGILYHSTRNRVLHALDVSCNMAISRNVIKNNKENLKLNALSALTLGTWLGNLKIQSQIIHVIGVQFPAFLALIISNP